MREDEILVYYISKAREIESRLNLPFAGDWEDLLDVKEYVEAYGEMAGVEVMTDAEYAFFMWGMEEFLEYNN